MTNFSKGERVSVLVDDEAAEFESRLSIDELINDDDEKARWSRYHIIRDALQGHLPERIDPDFSRKVMARVLDEAPGVTTTSVPNSYTKPAIGLALAASVAVVTVLGFQSLTGSRSVQMTAPIAQTVPQAVAPQQAAVVAQPPAEMRVGVLPGIQQANVDESMSPPGIERADARLNSYLVNHTEHAPSRTTMPYARVVGYGPEQQK